MAYRTRARGRARAPARRVRSRRSRRRLATCAKRGAFRTAGCASPSRGILHVGPAPVKLSSWKSMSGIAACDHAAMTSAGIALKSMGAPCPLRPHARAVKCLLLPRGNVQELLPELPRRKKLCGWRQRGRSGGRRRRALRCPQRPSSKRQRSGSVNSARSCSRGSTGRATRGPRSSSARRLRSPVPSPSCAQPRGAHAGGAGLSASSAPCTLQHPAVRSVRRWPGVPLRSFEAAALGRARKPSCGALSRLAPALCDPPA